MRDGEGLGGGRREAPRSAALHWLLMEEYHAFGIHASDAAAPGDHRCGRHGCGRCADSRARAARPGCGH